MTDLGQILHRLGIDQYLDAFTSEGFDTWETVLDIQETDLDALNVRLGHRRKLQREIANYRGLSYDRSLGSPGHEHQGDPTKSGEAEGGPPSSQGDRGVHGETKRKYRRHPRPDENAPERPPSAYVIFSNKIREDVRGQNLSFTEIAKLVGENWQTLAPDDKEPYEGQAAAAKERYNAQLAEYKKTDQHKAYVQYLAEFKAKHGGATTEGKQEKRPRLDPELSNATSSSVSGGSIPTKPGDTYDSAVMSHSLGHGRGESRGSIGSTTQQSGRGSPGGFFSNAPQPREGTPVPLLLSASSGGTESPFPQMDPTDANARNVTLPPPVPASFSASANNGPRRPTRLPVPLLQHHDTTTSTTSMTSMGSMGSMGSLSNVSSGSGSSGMGLYPTTPVDEPWQGRPLTDVPRSFRPPLAAHPAATSFISLPPLKASERTSITLPLQRKYNPSSGFAPTTSMKANNLPGTSIHHDPDRSSRNLPPLSGFGGPDTPRRLRSASRSTTDSRGSPHDMSDTISSTTDALAVLAYAGDMLENHKLQRHDL